jgi:hypothetical protein
MQVIALLLAAILVLILLAVPWMAKSAMSSQPISPAVVPAPAHSARLIKPTGLVAIDISEVGMPASDGGSKDPAIKFTPSKYVGLAVGANADKWICADILVKFSTPAGLVGVTHPAITGDECVASMKVPAGTPLNAELDFSRAGGWISSVEGGHATADVVNEKVGPDHIVHKHIAGVKYEDITVVADQTAKINIMVTSYTPQTPQTPPSPK